ncbi:MAG: LPXTG cell wall anchor domain-containing protein [Erysipelothrix sp.]|nr:LPXTG cell wall anchor domain-containing protein [Erysipelothrix sp.]
MAVVLAEYEAITNKVKGVGDDKLVINAEYSTALVAINEAVSNLVKEVEKPVEPSDTNESATDRPDVNTGIHQDYPLFGLGLSIISLAGYVHLRKRKMTAEN